MTSLSGYTAEQALARDLLSTALNRGVKHWAGLHGYTLEGPPDQVRAEGIDTSDRCEWVVNLDDIARATARLAADPERYAARNLRAVRVRVHSAASTVRAAQRKLAHGITPGSGPEFYADLTPHLGDTADVVLRIAGADAVTR